jgi:hypothetical protein
MNGESAEPCVATISKPTNRNTTTIGTSHHALRSKRRLKICLTVFDLLILLLQVLNFVDFYYAAAFEDSAAG